MAGANAPDEFFINAASVHVVAEVDDVVVEDVTWGTGVPGP
jgi:hypothetical protein